ncbi:hypothetical protein [Variovorax sp. HJSM1_2]|uniref:hypothetical protein n=1 Tax=Variovorax sp. HJSM1_2 TaxID=3366263 RepID=UPI003BC3D2B9
MTTPRFSALALAMLYGLAAPAFALSSGDPLALQLAALEGARAERQACAWQFPELREKNEAAFRASPYAKWTSEELIQAMASGEEQAKQLAGLPALRATYQKSMGEMPAEARRRLCSSMAAYLEDLTQKGVSLGPKPQVDQR